MQIESHGLGAFACNFFGKTRERDQRGIGSACHRSHSLTNLITPHSRHVQVQYAHIRLERCHSFESTRAVITCHCFKPRYLHQDGQAICNVSVIINTQYS